jgi:hypothetical protein
MNTKQIRQKILDLAIRGELVPQAPTDEPASVLLERIRAEKEQLIKDKKLKRDKKDNEPIDEVPFELPEGWEWCRLGEIQQVVTGSTPTKKNDKYYGNDYPFYKPTDLDAAYYVMDAQDNLSSLGYEEARKLPEKSILVTCIGATIGKTGLIRREGSCNQQINAILPNSNISPEFSYFVCISSFFQNNIIQNASATTLPILNKSKFEELLFPLPPLAEQHRIVQITEQLLTIVDTIEQLQEQLKSDVKQARNQVLNYAIAGKLTHQDPNDEPAEELLKRIGKTTATDTPYEKLPKGWTWCRLGDIANISMGQSPKGETVTRNSNGVEFHQGKIYFTDKYIDKSPFSTSEPTKITSNSVLLCVRAPVGEVNLVNREVCIGRGLCAIEPLGDISIDFCFFWLILLKDYFNENSTGSTFSSISGQIIRNAFIPLPPLAEQHRIVEKIESFFASFDQIEKELA